MSGKDNDSDNNNSKLSQPGLNHGNADKRRHTEGPRLLRTSASSSALDVKRIQPLVKETNSSPALQRRGTLLMFQSLSKGFEGLQRQEDPSRLQTTSPPAPNSAQARFRFGNKSVGMERSGTSMFYDIMGGGAEKMIGEDQKTKKWVNSVRSGPKNLGDVELRYQKLKERIEKSEREENERKAERQKAKERVLAKLKEKILLKLTRRKQGLPDEDQQENGNDEDEDEDEDVEDEEESQESDSEQGLTNIFRNTCVSLIISLL